MITVQQATQIINQVAFRPGAEKIKLGDATGCVLAEKIGADRDLPPFHRATMDGIAIKFEAYKNGQREFLIEGIQQAGSPQMELKSGCIEIMTGAMLPRNSDTVVRYEDVTINDGKAIINGPVEENQSVHSRGIDALKGSILLQPGTRISSAEVAILASVGKEEVVVFNSRPFAIITTGNELVDIGQTPLPYQIRKSNGVALASSLEVSTLASHIFHLPDNPEVLEAELQKIINDHDVIIISGGVSKGKFDFVPRILEKCGINKLFHQIKQRPGKPFWFGRSETKTVFALPGNPVSTFLCFHRYIKPWIEAGMGIEPQNIKAILSEDYSFKPDLTFFLQVKVDMSEGKISAAPDAGQGSGDFANLRNVDGFIELPSDRSNFQKGELFPYIPFR